MASTGKNFALLLFLAYLFVLFSRITDFVLTGFHIPAILFLMAVPAAALAGGLQRLPVVRPIVYLGGFAVWFALAIPFSVWRGGSIQEFKVLLMGLALIVPIVGLSETFADVRKIFLGLAVAIGAFALFTLLAANTATGRLSIETGGTFSNTNDLAQVLLLGTPFLVFALYEWRKRAVRVLGALAVLGVIAVSLARTGSRSLLLAGGVMALLVFLRASLPQKLLLAVAGAVLALAVVVVAPRSVLMRYVTFFRPVAVESLTEKDLDDQMSAIASALNREELLKDSIRFTFQHPVFGVGPGMFAVARGEERQKEMKFGNWKVTHNAYTQVSSECGIPALLFYLLAWGSAYRVTWAASRRHKGLNNPVSQSIRFACWTLVLAMVSVNIFAFFLSIAYSAQVIVLIALAAALDKVSAAELRKLQLSFSNTAAVADATRQMAASKLLPQTKTLPAR